MNFKGDSPITHPVHYALDLVIYNVYIIINNIYDINIYFYNNKTIIHKVILLLVAVR